MKDESAYGATLDYMREMKVDDEIIAHREGVPSATFINRLNAAITRSGVQVPSHLRAKYKFSKRTLENGDIEITLVEK